MGLFTKKIVTATAPLYTIGEQPARLIIGLGNPGRKFDGTRHNIGFACLDDLAKALDFPAWSVKKDLKTALTVNTLGGNKIILIKPTTFMNNSGEALQAVQRFYKVPNSQVIVVYDELALPFGQVRTRFGGSSAGHNGIKSLLGHCGGDFNRVRIGIKNEDLRKIDSADFVLQKFNAKEKRYMAALLKEVQSILVEFLYRGELIPESRRFII